MHNHAPAGYACPMCEYVANGENDLIGPADLAHRTELALAVVSPRWWPNNPGHLLVVPSAHFENLYELESAYAHAVHDLVREIAIAVRETYGCTGVSTRQHNEPDGNQDMWHFHVHVFPRYPDDSLYSTRPIPGTAPAERRHAYAERIRRAIGADVGAEP